MLQKTYAEQLATFKQDKTAAEALLKADWPHPYSREQAAYPVPALRRQKYWSPVGRVDNVHGDRNLFCNCVPLSAYAE